MNRSTTNGIGNGCLGSARRGGCGGLITQIRAVLLQLLKKDKERDEVGCSGSSGAMKHTRQDFELTLNCNFTV